MEGYAIGLAVGLGAGIAIGISVGKKQKTWSELSAGERKSRLITLAAGGVLFLAGVAVFLTGLFA